MQDLILLHGALGTSDSLQSLIHEIKDEFRCHSFNFSGHGNVPFSNDFSIEQFSQELNDFITSKALTSCFVFGYSMGGYVALYAVAKGNSKIKKIVTLGTKFHWNPAVAAKEAAKFNMETIKANMPEFAAQLQLQHGEPWEILVQQTQKLLLRLGDDPVVNDFLLSKINIPVTLGIGEKDRMVSMEETNNTCLKLSHGKFLKLASQPHLLERVDMKILAPIIKNEFRSEN